MGFIKKSKKFPNQFTLYIPAEKVEAFTKARKVLDREGVSLSEFCVEKVTKHGELHAPGNPQQLLATIFENGTVTKVKQCQWPNCELPAYRRGRKSNRRDTMLLCSSHFDYCWSHNLIIGYADLKK